jgi:CRISPR-associated protein Cmr1
VFPRAAFGLPIIFHFQGGGDPDDYTLQAGDSDRMASPLILRPYLSQERKWHSAALLLPVQIRPLALLDMKKKSQGVSYWNPAQARNVPPIRDNKGADALSAFMEFFK